MSLSGHLCLFTIVGLLLPTTGQTQPVTTPISRADSTPVNTRVLTSPVHPELQPVPLTPTPQADEASPPPPETQTQQPTSMDVHLTAGPGTDKSSTEADPTKGITLSQKPPGKAFATDPDLRPAGQVKLLSPYSIFLSADETTLRKHGLLVAAVLFITGIIILTSGKCRQFSQLCRNYNR
ncbi:FXYD domain-containing ion transport regulator 5 isoform 1-T1 [Hipposideros larvatus]